MPGGRLLIWLATRTDPLNYPTFAIVMLAMFALAAVGMVRLLVVLFGRRWGIVPPLVVFLFSPLLIPATMWWAAGVNQLPALATITWGLAAHVRYLRSRRTSDLVSTVAWVAFGLAFAELALIVYAFIGVLTVCYFVTGTLRERLRSTATTCRRAVIVHGVVVAGYVAWYWSTFSGLRTRGPKQSAVSYFVDMGTNGSRAVRSEDH